MRFLVLGCGSIGKRHIRNLISLGNKEIIGCDVNKKILDGIKKETGVEVSTNFEESVKKADAVLVCTPNNLHTKFIIPSLQQGKHVFVEKPLADKLDRFDEIKKLVREKKLILYVGLNLRQHPLLIKTKKLLENNEIGKIYYAKIEFGSYFPNWRPGQDYKKNYGANKAMGGGIILDDIHEIDYAIWLFGKIKNIYCNASRISDVTVDTEDNADMLLKTERGFNVNIHMDYLQKARTRKFKIIGSKGLIKGDINKNELKIFKDDKWSEQKEEFDYNNTYVQEIKEFINCIKEKKKPSTGFEEGAYCLRVALAAKKSAEKNRVVDL